MDVSKFLAKVIGIYLIIISAAMFVNMQNFMTYAYSLMLNTPLMFVTGLITIILGLVMVISHNIWQWNWRVIITIFCWVALLKGISIVLYPQFIDNITTIFFQNMKAGYIAASIDLALGLLLSYFGFKR